MRRTSPAGLDRARAMEEYRRINPTAPEIALLPENLLHEHMFHLMRDRDAMEPRQGPEAALARIARPEAGGGAA